MESKDTLIQTNTILEAISGLRQEMNERFNNIEARLRFVEDQVGDVKQRLLRVEADVSEIKNLNVSFDARIDRLQSLAHESLQIGYTVKADVTILRAEVGSWTQDVMELQRKVA